MKLKYLFPFMILCIGISGSAHMTMASAEPSGIMIEDSESIVQLRLGTMRMDLDSAGKRKLEEILDLLECVTPVGEDMQDTLNRGADFYGILLIHKDGTKEKFYFFSQNDKWYMETGEGIFYENAEGITDIVNIQKIDSSVSMPIETVQYLLSQDQDRKRLEYAKKEGFYPTDQELSEMTETYIKDMEQAENYKDSEELCKNYGTTFADLIRNNNDFILHLMVSSRFSELRRIEYMEGTDTINGKIYDNFSDYERAYLNEYVYSME